MDQTRAPRRSRTRTPLVDAEARLRSQEIIERNSARFASALHDDEERFIRVFSRGMMVGLGLALLIVYTVFRVSGEEGE